MNREAAFLLESWKSSDRRKPLLLRGARQVGKSHLVRTFGAGYPSFVELNFEERPDAARYFAGDLSPHHILSDLQVYLNARIIPGKTLLFLDEIQECVAAITALRYFYEKLPELHVVSAGSLLEFELQKIGLPVGRIQSLYLYPLSFREFLAAQGEDILLEEIQRLPTKQALSEAAHQRLLNQVRTYCLVGGMPEVVSSYLESKSLPLCREIQAEIITTYRQDILKYSKDARLGEVRTVFDAVPREIGNKLKYSKINREIRSTYLAEALELLCHAGVVRKVCHTSANGVPLVAELDPRSFKCIFVDIGLAVRLLGLDTATVNSVADIELINRGALAEQFVGQELIAAGSPNEETPLYYWRREVQNSNAEVDYITSNGSRVIPIEVKAGAAGRLRSLHLFLEQKPQHNKGVRIYSGLYRHEAKFLHLPFYAVSVLKDLIGQ